mgnify:CR=1 FL=1
MLIRDLVAPYSYPVAFNVPCGHVDHNIPLIESAKVKGVFISSARTARLPPSKVPVAMP